MKALVPIQRSWVRLVDCWQQHERLRFIVIGVYNTAFGYVAFAATYLLLHRRMHYLGILVLVHLVAVSNAFLGHKYLTFQVRGNLLKDYLRFNLAYLGVLAVGLIGLPFLVEVCRLHPLAGQAILNLLTILSSYLLHKHLSFRRA
ncbi:MAG: GtrA family protein [Acidobacteria bacterium]|nr:GtrA family protein [Acidobacteriota bacterium]MBI3488430.1 GtrA family protein [Acidobacteriota bacterium]